MTQHITAHDVANYLERKRYGGDQWVVFREVRNATGFARKRERYADLLAFSVWPSRGIYLEGVEIKVSRSDWLRELEDPAKADEFFQYCRHWFVAAPRGVVELSEVPATWGFIEVTGKRHRIAKQPRENNKPKPLDALLFASLARHLKKTHGYSERDVQRLARERVAQAEKDIQRAGRAMNALRQLERLQRKVDEFQKATGVCIDWDWHHGKIARLVELFEHIHPDAIQKTLERNASTYEHLAQQIRDAASELKTEREREIAHDCTLLRGEE